jgi:hypothetical protein
MKNWVHFNPEDRGGTVPWTVGIHLQDCTVLQPLNNYGHENMRTFIETGGLSSLIKTNF